MVEDVVRELGGSMPIGGWQLQLNEERRACPRCGVEERPLYQGQRNSPGGWSLLPDALLCDRCVQVRFAVPWLVDADHGHQRRPWWRFW